MEIHSEMRLLQIGPGISTSYTIFARESSSSEDPGPHIGNIGDIFLSLTTLHFKSDQDQWITVAERDLIHHPTHHHCDLSLSTTGPRWGFDCQPSLTIAEAIKQHWDRINSICLTMKMILMMLNRTMNGITIQKIRRSRGKDRGRVQTMGIFIGYW